MRAKCILFSVAATATAACTSQVEPEPEPEVEPSDYTPFEGPAPDTCPTNMCGDGNSPVIAGVYFWRLSVVGHANPEGVRIVSVSKNGLELELELVDGDRLRAIGPGITLEHELLEGVVIRVSVPGSSGPSLHDIEIGRVMPNNAMIPVERFWVSPYYGIEAYDFYYTPVGTALRVPLCSEASKNFPASIDTAQLRAVVFGRELYNPLTKEITTGLLLTANWINFACVNGAPYKMQKIGYTLPAKAKAITMPQTTLAQRKAMLNAWTANVCGDGTSYTHPGIPIRLTETHDALPYNSPYMDPFNHDEIIEFEALWDEDGAVCMDGHRLDPFPGGAGMIPCRATLPSCADLTDGPDEWMQHGHVATAVPMNDDP